MTAPRPDRAALRRAAEAALERPLPGDRAYYTDVSEIAASFRAAANPAAVLALLDALDAADARLAAVEALCERWERRQAQLDVEQLISIDSAVCFIRRVVETGIDFGATDPTPSPAEEADDRRDQDDFDARDGRL